MLTLEQLEAEIVTLREEVTQALQLARHHAPEHADEGQDPYQQASAAGVTVTKLIDADGDTQIQVEESADEDIIRFDVVSIETLIMGDTGGAGVFGGSVHQMHFPMQADRDILVDGATNNRTIDTGVMRFEQTPAIENTRAVTVNVDANSQPGSHAIVVNMTATQIAAGEMLSAYDVNIIAGNSSGGIVRAFEVSIAGTSGVTAHALHVDPNVVPLMQRSGSFGNVESAWENAVDVTAAFNAAGTDVELFSSNGDVVTIGMDAAFDTIEAILATEASGAGIKPTFEFSIAGPAWTTFTPSDETQGFRQSGIIEWNSADLTNWVATLDNGVTKFWIRITRTQVGLTTPPTEDTIQVQAITEFSWSALGAIIALSLSTDTISERTPANGVVVDGLTIKDGAAGTVDFDDTDVTAAELETLTDTSDADALHEHPRYQTWALFMAGAGR